MQTKPLIIQGARQNNLKNISLTLPHNAFIVVTGLSGSGKSSLAFDTIFAEGQWRFIESLSPYARLFIEKLDRPDVDHFENLRPAIALEQQNTVKTSRSTVATSTELYDYLRLLFSKIATPHCVDCGNPLKRYSPSEVSSELMNRYQGERALIIFHSNDRPDDLRRRGFHRLRSHGKPLEQDDQGLASPVEVVLDRLILDDEQRVADSIETAWKEGDGAVTVEIIDKGALTFSSRFRCSHCHREAEPIDPNPMIFSFNHPVGACPECKGFGDILTYDEDKIIPDPKKSLKDMAIEPWSKPATKEWLQQFLHAAASAGIDATVPYQELSQTAKDLIFNGSPSFYGIKDFFSYLDEKKYKLHVRVFISKYRKAYPCPACKGTRLKRESLCFKLAGLTIADLLKMSARKLQEFLTTVEIDDYQKQMSAEILRQLELKLNFLQRVGLGYLTLDRASKTLSGGESQRVKLSNQLASRLTSALYVLDEPTIGLHPADVSTIIEVIKELTEIGNTLLVVEHDSAVIGAADWIVEMGIGSGLNGGEAVFSGEYSDFIKTDALTARYLRQDERIQPRFHRRIGKGFLTVKGACGNNLQHIDVKLPLKTMICVTGVSGSGKSTLVNDTIYKALASEFKVEFLKPAPFIALQGAEHLKGVHIIDQNPIGKTPRSNPATYIKAFDGIRKFYANLPESKREGFEAGHFSFNTEDGRCDACKGEGFQKLEMYFFEDIYIQCEQCKGARFKDDILAIAWRNKNIHDVLQMTVSEATAFFKDFPSMVKQFDLLSAVGLDYLRLGQPLTTLSGGEAQRLKICSELGLAKRRDYLYILDEPSVGLHPHDIKKLLEVLDKLVDSGNTVLMVEHNIDIIHHVDWVIDLGPGGGDNGGYIIAEGSPETIMDVEQSLTGRFLRSMNRV
jgi:excinuclease ABC subunit A